VDDIAASWTFRRGNGLTADEAAELESWRAASLEHAAALARHERAWSHLDQPLRLGQADLVLKQLASRAARRRRRLVAGAALACAVLVAAGVWWRTAPIAPAPPHRAIVVLPETRSLPDGTVVESKAGAAYAVEFGDRIRRVMLTRGEAHFQVAHETRPFIVVAGAVEFRAVGTAFAVQLGDAQVSLLVTQGRVAIDRPPAAATTEAATPAPRAELAQVEAGGGAIVTLTTVPAVELLAPASDPTRALAEKLAWRVPRLEFTDTPLAEAVATMNRHNRVQLVLRDDELAKVAVSGLFRADRLEAFVRLLETNFDVQATPQGNELHLRRRR
jgi:transmembrane sensor